MVYKKFKDIQLSNLGLGCMRLPLKEGINEIDENKTLEMIDVCLKNGINYFDTAYMYHEGKSEIVIGKLLKKYPRESFYLASKFPGFSKESFENKEKIFNEQLEKCQVEYFDFYLLHNVTEGNVDNYLDENIGLINYLLEQKHLGKIKYLGFSAHGNLDTLKKFLSKYSEYMEFCQLQINYIDWTFQEASKKVELMKEYNIPVWVMEPLRGGRLANINDEYKNELLKYRDESVVTWAFRFLQSIPEVTMILSGMSNLEQLLDNINTFSEYKPLNGKEMDCILEVARKMSNGIPCTECRYCTAYCPNEIDIPRMIRYLNEESFTGRLSMTYKNVPIENRAESCIACRACEAVCPQNIKISDVMSIISSKIK